MIISITTYDVIMIFIIIAVVIVLFILMTNYSNKIYDVCYILCNNCNEIMI